MCIDDDTDDTVNSYDEEFRKWVNIDHNVPNSSGRVGDDEIAKAVLEEKNENESPEIRVDDDRSTACREFTEKSARKKSRGWAIFSNVE